MSNKTTVFADLDALATHLRDKLNDFITNYQFNPELFPEQLEPTEEAPQS